MSPSKKPSPPRSPVKPARSRRGNDPDPLVGAHTSIAGGVHRAVERGCATGCRAIQIFTSSNQQWRAREITDEDAERFRRASRRLDVRPVAAHASYLVNLASRDRTTRRRSQRALRGELERAEKLRLPNLVLHPGSHGGAGVREGLARVAEGIARALDETASMRVRVLFENTAGQGHMLGARFEEIAALVEALGGHPRLGLCLDTCHAFAAGYDLRDETGYRRTMRELRSAVGARRLRVIHVNDSRGELGSRLDRHTHIGKGKLGRNAFALLMRDRRLERIPKILETPKGKDGREDRVNLALLRKLARG
jgi:deoxyribonuclease-4